jgi:hypothetical protein
VSAAACNLVDMASRRKKADPKLSHDAEERFEAWLAEARRAQTQLSVERAALTVDGVEADALQLMALALAVLGGNGTEAQNEAVERAAHAARNERTETESARARRIARAIVGARFAVPVRTDAGWVERDPKHYPWVSAEAWPEFIAGLVVQALRPHEPDVTLDMVAAALQALPTRGGRPSRTKPPGVTSQTVALATALGMEPSGQATLANIVSTAIGAEFIGAAR